MLPLQVGDVTLTYPPGLDAMELSGGEFAVEETVLLDGTSLIHVSEKASALRLNIRRVDGYVVTAAERRALLTDYEGRVTNVSCSLATGPAIWAARPVFYGVTVEGLAMFEYELAFIMGGL